MYLRVRSFGDELKCLQEPDLHGGLVVEEIGGLSHELGALHIGLS
jgi:hypothetical protein